MNKRNAEYRALTGHQNGIPYWHIVEISKLKLPLIEKKLESGDTNASDLGTITISGWGSIIPKDIEAKYLL